MLLLLTLVTFSAAQVPPTTTPNCATRLPRALLDEIGSYQAIAAQIRQAVLKGPFKGRTYKELALFTDTFGSRFTGTANLESSIDYMLAKMRDDGLENVHGEEVTVTRWVRGHESAHLILPRRQKIGFVGLANSVSTPPEGITAELLVVHSFAELDRRAAEAKGKIIVFNANWTSSESYSQLSHFHMYGPSAAVRVGGVAALARSGTPFSIYSPLAGTQLKVPGLPKIPGGVITVEDAEFFDRCQDRGWKMVLHLKLTSAMLPNTTSRNVIGDLVGRESPDQVVVIGAHIDSYDVGASVMDDGGGVITIEGAMALLTRLNLRPRRTLRSVFWTGNEMDRLGQKQYKAAHSAELRKHIALFDIDRGTFAPVGFDFVGGSAAGCIVQEVLKLLAPINATVYKLSKAKPHVLGGLYPFTEEGVPGLSLRTGGDQFYWYHHSEGDTMTIEDPHNLDYCLVAVATVSYVIDDLSVSLPRE